MPLKLFIFPDNTNLKGIVDTIPDKLRLGCFQCSCLPDTERVSKCKANPVIKAFANMVGAKQAGFDLRIEPNHK